MEKSAFLRELSLILRKKGLSDEEIRPKVDKISAFIDNLSPEERNAVIGGNPDVSAIADRLFARDRTVRPQSGQAGQADNRPQNPSRQRQTQDGAFARTGNRQVSAGQRQGNRDAADPEQAAANQRASGKPSASLRTPAGTDTGNFHITSDYKKSTLRQGNGGNGRKTAEIRRRDEEKLKQLRSEAQKPRKAYASVDRNLCERYENDRKFWIIFFCSLPLLFFIAALILGVFAMLYGIMVAVIIVLVALMAAAVAAGSALALVGVFYGLTQIPSSLAVALYEIGMGLVIGGITMLFGILIYNAAIRLIPYLMKLVGRLGKFLWKKLGILADYLKGVCAAL